MRIQMRVPLLATTVVCAMAVAPSLGGPAVQAQTSAVSIQNFAFSPDPFTVPVGATVTWTNGDEAAHTATSDMGAFGSAVLSQGQSFSFKFSVPGTYAYHCDIHPYMKGTIIVSAGAPAPTATQTPPPATPTATSAGSPPPPPATSTATAAPTATPTATSKPSPKLSLQVSPKSVSAGSTTTLTVSVHVANSKKAVSGVTIAVNGKAVGLKSVPKAKTNAQGKASLKRLKVLRRGALKLTAKKAGYTTAKASIRVR
jgi:plastocyanin